MFVAGLAIWIAPRGDVPPFNPMGGQATYLPTDTDARVLVEPWLHAPWRGARPLFASLVLAFAATAAAVSLALALGATPVAAWLAAAAVLVSAPFSTAALHVADAALACTFTWIGWRLALVAADGRRSLLILAATAWGLAIVASWLALAAAPLLLLAWMHVGRTVRGRAIATAGVCAIGTAALFLHAIRVAGAVSASVTPGAAGMTMADVWAGLFDHSSRVGLVQFAPPDLWGPYILTLALAAAAVVFCDWPRWLRLGVIGSAATLGVICLQWPVWRPEALLWGSWTATPLVAAGLAWSVAQISPRWRTLAAVAVGVVLVGGSAAAARRPLGGRDSRAVAHQMQRLLDRFAQQERPIALVAEDTLVDSAVAAWGRAPRVSQRPEAVSRALADGLDPVAGPEGRGHLELFGFRLETVASLDDPAPYHLSRVVERLRCATVRTDRWSFLPGVDYTGRLGLDMPSTAGARLLLIVGDDLPVQMRGTLMSGQAMPLRQEVLMSGTGTATPPPDYWFDGGDPARAPQRVVRLTIPAHPVETTLVSLYLGRRAPRVLARLEGYDAAAVGRVCAAPLGPDALWGRSPERDVTLPLDEARLFGVGWHGLEGVSGDRFRWTGSDAAILVPSAVQGPVLVMLDAAPAVESGASGPTLLTLRVNGHVQPPQAMGPGVARYEWTVGRTVWLAGTNELLFSVSQSVRPADRAGDDTRVLGLRVHEVRLGRR